MRSVPLMKLGVHLKAVRVHYVSAGNSVPRFYSKTRPGMFTAATYAQCSTPQCNPTTSRADDDAGKTAQPIPSCDSSVQP